MTGILDDTALAADDRGVSEVIGAILIFGVVVMLLTLVQTQLIPQANEDVEFQHSQEIQSDFAELQTQIQRAVSTGDASSATVNLGMTYPPRLLFFNPPPPQGRLETSDGAAVELSNVRSSSSAGVFFENAPPADLFYDARSLNYSVAYNRLSNEPVLTREPAAVYHAEDGAKLVSGTSLIDGSEISLTLVGGDMATTGIVSEEIEAKALSAPAKSYQVRNTPGNRIRITVPTHLSEQKWQELLADEMVSQGGHVTGIDYTQTVASPNELTVTLEQGTAYSLKMGKVGFGDGGDPLPKYMVTTDSEGGGAAVEVRDKYNNPVGGVTVTASVSPPDTITDGSTSGSTIDVTTGPDGVASVEVASGSPNQVEFSEDLDGDGLEPALEERTASFFRGVFLTDATGSDGSSSVELHLTNTGGERELQGVRLGHVTEISRKQVVDSTSLIELLGVNVVGTTTSSGVANLKDGPDSITSVQIDGSSTSVSATENGGPATLSGLALSGSQTVTLTFDESYPLESEDALSVRVRLYFADGTSRTYDVMLHGGDDT